MTRGQPLGEGTITQNEFNVAFPVYTGKTVKQAAILNRIKYRAAKARLDSVYWKLGVSSRIQFLKAFKALDLV